MTVSSAHRPAALPLRLSAFYFSHFALIGIALPYWPVWLQGRGLGAVEIAVILSVGRWVGAGATPAIALLADRRGELKILVMALAAGILAWEHRLVKPGDLSRLNAAFFNMNAVMSVTVFLFALVDVVL